MVQYMHLYYLTGVAKSLEALVRAWFAERGGKRLARTASAAVPDDATDVTAPVVTIGAGVGAVGAVTTLPLMYERFSVLLKADQIGHEVFRQRSRPPSHQTT